MRAIQGFSILTPLLAKDGPTQFLCHQLIGQPWICLETCNVSMCCFFKSLWHPSKSWRILSVLSFPAGWVKGWRPPPSFNVAQRFTLWTPFIFRSNMWFFQTSTLQATGCMCWNTAESRKSGERYNLVEPRKTVAKFRRSTINSLKIHQNQLNSMNYWLVVSKIFYFHPYLGKIPNLTNIFQRGWNHQLDYFWVLSVCRVSKKDGNTQSCT